MSIVLQSSGGGSVTVQEPATASNFTQTLPTTNGTLATIEQIANGFRNRIINGDMRIDQRNAGASVTPTNGQYTLDRWRFLLTQTSKLTTQQNAGSVTPPVGFTNYLGITSSSAYSIVAGDAFVLQQFVEGFNVADLGWGTASAQTVTLSFWVRSSLTGTFGGALGNSAIDRSYPFSYTISAANTWEQKSVTIAGDTSGTWLTTNGLGIRLSFGLGVGSDLTATSGAWTGSYRLSSTGATSVVGTSGATFYVTGVQLEVGSSATPFDRRSYGTELALCQRYYEVLPLNPSLFTLTGTYFNASDFRANWFFKQTKRALPTLAGTWFVGPTATFSNVDSPSYFHTTLFYNTSPLTADAEL